MNQSIRVSMTKSMCVHRVIMMDTHTICNNNNCHAKTLTLVGVEANRTQTGSQPLKNGHKLKFNKLVYVGLKVNELELPCTLGGALFPPQVFSHQVLARKVLMRPFIFPLVFFYYVLYIYSCLSTTCTLINIFLCL